MRNRGRRIAQWLTAPLRRGGIVMLGDSLTEGGHWDEQFPGLGLVNCGVGGDTVRDVAARLDGVYRLAPRKLFLLVGINDVSCGTTIDAIVEDYRALLTAVREHLPATTVFVQSVLPVDRRWVRARNDDIVRLNSEIARLAAGGQLVFVDLHSRFADRHGELREGTSGDGLHLSPAGYALWYGVAGPLIRGPQIF